MSEITRRGGRSDGTLHLINCKTCGNVTTRPQWKRRGWLREERPLAAEQREVRYVCPQCAHSQEEAKPVVVARCVQCHCALPTGHVANVCTGCAQMFGADQPKRPGQYQGD